VSQWSDQKQEFDLGSANGQMTLPFGGETCQVEITFLA
jgi:hypothetical protein